MPRRIQRQRTKGWRMPEGAVYVGRGTKWGNPFAVGGPSGLAREPAIANPGHTWVYEGRCSEAGMQHDYHHSDGRTTEVHVRAMTRAEAVECYKAWLAGGGWPIDWNPIGVPTVEEIRAELAGKDLACWCPLEDRRGGRVPCHADLLLEIANKEPEQ